MSAGLALSLRGLSKSFWARPVLDGLSLPVPAGQFLAVVGRSGCGKTTLLRLLAGLERPTAGSAELAGSATDVRMVFQEARLLPWRTVAQNVAVGLGSFGRQVPPTVHQALAQVGLDGRGADWPATLSGGQRQRVALARALVSRPRLLLLDEPLGALDALTRLEMQALLERLWADVGFTAVLVTHDVEEAVALADRVLVLDAGRVALDLPVSLPRPRPRHQPSFGALVSAILGQLGGRAEPQPALAAEAIGGVAGDRRWTGLERGAPVFREKCPGPLPVRRTGIT
jgi:sulfonate transport system ATP-binding protein